MSKLLTSSIDESYRNDAPTSDSESEIDSCQSALNLAQRGWQVFCSCSGKKQTTKKDKDNLKSCFIEVAKKPRI